ncbi:MAG: hypothetical protein JW929_12345 [Anaerolineales bacterium]|nr:hypothetical protein [Anaerolineales bacterium]
MEKSSARNCSKRWWILPALLLPLLSCTTINQMLFPPTPTPTPTATPTPTPTNTPSPTPQSLADLNLAEIALQESDLPSGFEKNVIPDIGEALAESIGGAGDVITEDLVKDYAVLYMHGQDQFFLNAILVYSDSAQASTVYSFFAARVLTGSAVDIPAIGELSIAGKYYDSGVYSYSVFWLYREAVFELDYVGVADVSIDGLVHLAQIIQGRVEAV